MAATCFVILALCRVESPPARHHELGLKTWSVHRTSGNPGPLESCGVNQRSLHPMTRRNTQPRLRSHLFFPDRREQYKPPRYLEVWYEYGIGAMSYPYDGGRKCRHCCLLASAAC